jgi:site-specific DNA-methyltransferase (adenine-specific)
MEGDSLNGVDLRLGDCLDVMKTIPDGSVHCCVTSPPYFGLRDYGVDGQIGLEPTPDQFVEAIVRVFREVRRVLRDDGTVWLNLGDSYARAGGWSNNSGLDGVLRNQSQRAVSNISASGRRSQKLPPGLKQKDLIGIPWLVAFALRNDGWFLRQELIWHKPNPIPERIAIGRCAKSHEHIFLLSKTARPYFDGAAIAVASLSGEPKARQSVWSVPVRQYKGAHFATFPPDLIEPCILAGSPKGGVVLDPFGGSGTTAGVAVKHGRKAILCELNPEYANLVRERVGIIAGNCAISNSAPLNDNNRTEMSPLQILIQRALAA